MQFATYANARTRGTVAAAGLASIAAGAGCHASDALGPAAVAGTYALQSIAGTRLPYSLPSGRTWSTTLNHDTLVLAAAGSVDERRVVQVVNSPCPQPPSPAACGTPVIADGVPTEHVAGTWAMRGGQVVLRLGADSAVATLGADRTLNVSRDLGLGPVALAYAPVP